MKGGRSLGINYDKNKNIIAGKPTREEKDLIHNAIKTIDPELILYSVDYKKNPKLEANGWDIKGKRSVGIQIKTRRPKWWFRRGQDFPIETKDGNRPDGLGWFQLYRNKKIIYMIFIWRCCTKLEEGDHCIYDFKKRNCDKCKEPRTKRFMQVYNNENDVFFETINKLNKINNYKIWEVNERGRDGVIRKVSGFTLPLKDIKNLLKYSTEESKEKNGDFDIYELADTKDTLGILK